MIGKAGKRARQAALLMAALLCSACLSNVQSLGPNMARLDLSGVEAGPEDLALQQLLALGARETLARGYTHFRFIDWAPGATQVVQPGQPLRANFAVTIVMFREGEQGSNPVFDARRIAQAR
ncbi:hypothetical protein WOC76_14825 [Methylocystis sp. IM3]|uniref:hypothetical protein n=1 Tax=unclassified Methylocystis TaxID=2625913 RepID=UPI000F923849|nr:MAG: hypothetical protein EKK29_07375 [Hyphomicrobiales bacterium]